MPLVRIDLPESAPPAQRRAIADGVNAALVRGLGMHENDRFQVIRSLPVESFAYDRHYLGVDRAAVVFVQILMVRGYSSETKKATFLAIAEELEAAGVRPDDVFVAVTENGPEDWYAGRFGGQDGDQGQAAP
jgi:phenylpyruvate tautomerase PptA (4-oxalocrotonate tautomerase family)